MPTFQIEYFNAEENEQGMRNSLDFLLEIWEEAYDLMTKYQ